METTQIKNTGMTMRRLGPDDADSIRRLAQRDSADRPAGSLIGIEVEGRLLAARSLDTGETIADPFARTVELRKLLAIRARQLTRRSNAAQSGRLRLSPLFEGRHGQPRIG